MVNYYSLLKIQPESTHEEIEKAFAQFKEELLQFSPGVNLSDAELRTRQKNKWEAFDVLLDKEKRKIYDENLERDRIHLEYEKRSHVAESKEERKSPDKASLIFLLIAIAVFGLYFIVIKILEKPEGLANWHTHYIVDDVKILLPAKTDTTIHILPPYLLSSIKNASSYKSELSNGFCITMAIVYMEEHFKIPFKDLAYMNSLEGQSPKIRNRKQGELINTTLKEYRVSIDKETYQYENIVRASDNYTLLGGNIGMKIIVNYNPGDELQVKYSDIIYKSLFSN